jgi:enamine deaminase RidA (YjgF/YER057c/UK114 family)
MLTATSTPSQRLAELGLELPAAWTASGLYAPASVVDRLAFTSGQLPLVDGRVPITGLVGYRAGYGSGLVHPDEAAELARIAALNGIAALADAVGGIDRIERIVKITGYVAAADGFADHTVVLDGASALVRDVFGTETTHARAALGVATLPFGSPVEIELTAVVR